MTVFVQVFYKSLDYQVSFNYSGYITLWYSYQWFELEFLEVLKTP